MQTITFKRGVTSIYDTAENGWTVEELEYTPAKPRHDFVEVPGRDGALDLTRAILASGTARAPLGQAELEAGLAIVCDTHAQAESKLDSLMSAVHGMQLSVTSAAGAIDAAEISISDVEFVDVGGRAVRVTVEAVG